MLLNQGLNAANVATFNRGRFLSSSLACCLSATYVQKTAKMMKREVLCDTVLTQINQLFLHVHIEFNVASTSGPIFEKNDWVPNISCTHNLPEG